MEKKEIVIDTSKVLLIDKPLGWTSFDVVKKLRILFGIKKIGHAGTLDPLATGLLLLCMGKQTKRLSMYQDLDKTYEGEIIVGNTTSSYDLETPLEGEKPYSHLIESDLLKACTSFVGKQKQIPPIHSACKVDGVRAYKKARKGEKVVLREREIMIHRFALTKIVLPSVHFSVTCSKGTYIRTLAHDFGQRLSVGAYLAKLRRTQIGDYKVDHAYSIPFLEEKKKAKLLHISDVA